MWEANHRELWKLDFPECAERALQQIKTHFVCDGNKDNIPGLGGPEEASAQIVDDFIFVHSSQRKPKHNRVPGSLQELRSLELIINLYNELSVEKVSETTSFSIFQALFSRAASDRPRAMTLSRLVSLAVSMNCGLILDTAALWMQLQGVQTGCVQAIIQTLITDFSSINKDKQFSLLPQTSKHFTCIFISVTLAIFKFPGAVAQSHNEVFYEQLLPLMTDWIVNEPSLCLISLIRSQHVQSLVQPQRATLWTSPTKPNTHTPIPGLVRWATQGPLHVNLAQPNVAPVQAQITNNYKSESKQCELHMLWSKLHLGILQIFTAFATVPRANQLEVITLADMKNIVDELVILFKKYEQTSQSQTAELCVDRMVQVLQLTLATGAFRCSLADLKAICQALPQRKLKTILESQHLSNNPPAMHNAS